MATNLRFVLVGEDRASSAFNRFERQLQATSRAVDRHNASLKQQGAAAAAAQGGLLGLAGTVSGFGDAATVTSRKTSMFAKALAGLNLATGVLEPAMAGLIVTTGALAAAGTAAAAGMGAYGLALKPVLTQVSELMKLQDQAAKGSKASQDQLKKALQSTPPVIVKFTEAVTSARDAYTDWGNSLARPVLAPLTAGLRLVKPVLTAISPLVRAAAGAFGTLVAELGARIEAGGLTRVVSVLLPRVRPVILDLAHSAGNVAAGIWGILRAFLPMATTITGGVERLTARFKEWAASLPSHSGFQSLMTMFRQLTPAAVEVLKNLAKAAVQVGSAMAGMVNASVIVPVLRAFSAVIAQLASNKGLVQAVLYLVLFRKVIGQVIGPLALAARGAQGFSVALAALTSGQGLAGAAAGLTAMGGGAAKAGGTMTLLGRAMVVMTGTLAGAVTGMVAAAAAGAGLAVALNRAYQSSTQLWIAQAREGARATGYNITGYQKFNTVLAEHERQLRSVTQADIDRRVGIVAGTRLAIAHQQAITQTSSAYQQNASELSRLNGFLATVGSQFSLTRDQAIRLAAAAGVNADQVKAGGKSYADAMAKAAAWGRQLDATTGQTNAQRIATTSLTTSLSSLAAQLTGNATAQLDWRDAQARAQAQLKATTGTLSLNTQAGRDNRRVILDATASALRFAQQQVSTGGNIRGASRTIQDQIRWLQSYGGNSRTTRDLIEQLRKKVRELRDQLNQVPSNKRVTVTLVGAGGGKITVSSSVKNAAGYLQFHATGGLVRGAGGPRSDSNLIAASRGEYVQKAAAVAKYGVKAMDAVNAGRAMVAYADGGLVGVPRYAVGGLVGPSSIASAVQLAYTNQQLREGAFGINRGTAFGRALLDVFRKGLTAAAGGSSSAIVNYARRFLGVPYVWGGTTPRGWDCSGFTSYVYRHFGYPIPRTSQQQWRWARHVSNRAGALAFFVGSGGGAPPGHVGISMGGGRMINAAGTQYGTIISGTGGAMGFGIPPGGFARGSWFVPKTGPAVVHRGEMIIPARAADAVRAGAGGGVTVTVNVAPAVAAASPHLGRDIAQHLTAFIRHGGQLYPAGITPR